MDRISARQDQFKRTAFVGPGPYGHHRKRTHTSASFAHIQPHPCRSAGRTRRSLGHGGRTKMFVALCCDRGDLGRPESSRFHCYAAACGRFGAIWGCRFSDSSWRSRQSQRRSHALADCEHSLAHQRSRSEGAGSSDVGCRTVSRSGDFSWTLEHCP